MSPDFFQILWFLILGLALAVWTVLDGFDLGAAMATPFLTRPEARKAAIHSFWPLWDGNALWGLTAGGALFAIFPLVFGQILSGLYPYVTLLLLGLILRPVAFEMWHHNHGSRLWLGVLSAASFLTLLLPGAVLGNTITGFSVGTDGRIAGGLLSVLNPYALLTALTLTALGVVHGLRWLQVKLPSGQLEGLELVSKIAFAAAVLLSITWISITGLVYLPPERGLFWVTGALALVFLVGSAVFKTGGKPGFSFSALGLGFFWISVALVQFPYLIKPSGAFPGLTVMDSAPAATLSFLGIAAPVVLLFVTGYTIYVYRVFRGKMDSSHLPSYD